jgi:hypothetical protein
VKTHKGGYPRVPPRPDALTALAQLSAWGGDHNERAGNERDHRGDLLNMRQSIRELWRPTEAGPITRRGIPRLTSTLDNARVKIFSAPFVAE